MAATHIFTKEEEIAHSITHGIGVILSIVALTTLVIFASLFGNVWHIVSFALFGITMVLLYVSSTLAHSFPDGRIKDLFEIMDHSAIYFFIAGSYTPFLFIAVKGWIGWTLFGILWSVSVIGTLLKIFFVKRFVVLSTLIYIVLGWLMVFAWNPIVSSLPSTGVILLVIGGVLYTVGSIFYVWRMFKYHHMVWHLFVLAGTATHFFSVLSLLPK